METEESPIRHIFVVGFHHKKGCQVEYCYPPLLFNSTRVSDEDLPPQWRHLSSLALPDGAHNYEKDTVFFHLPCNKDENKTLYGVSCYRQISADKLKNKADDVTRSTVQKSVCVLSTLPLYGLLKVKLELITQAYFNQCDFDKVELLSEMYEHLTCTVTKDMLQTRGLIGLSVRDLLLDFHQQTLILFKLMLLEKRVLFYGFPVHRVSHSILALLSLFPRMIEYGLVESAFYVPKFSLNAKDVKKIEKTENGVDVAQLENLGADEDSLLREIEAALNANLSAEGKSENDGTHNNQHSARSSVKDEDGRIEQLPKKSESSNAVRLKVDNFGFPLSLFAKGSLCHPYLSLVYLDLLKSEKIRSYVFGATNALYKQRKELVDVIVTMEDDVPRLEILDTELRKALALTTADLRFSDYLIKNVTQTGDVFVDNISWEGGDEWIRLQFRAYLLSLLATSKQSDLNKYEDFNELFMNLWMSTHNYRVWACGHHVDADSAVSGHPFRGQLSMADMKLRLSHSMQSSEQGRKLNQAVSQTGKYVTQTGKAVGGAVKSVMNQWWQGFGEGPSS